MITTTDISIAQLNLDILRENEIVDTIVGIISGFELGELGYFDDVLLISEQGVYICNELKFIKRNKDLLTILLGQSPAPVQKIADCLYFIKANVTHPCVHKLLPPVSTT